MLGLSDAEFKRLRDLQVEYNLRHLKFIQNMEVKMKCHKCGDGFLIETCEDCDPIPQWVKCSDRMPEPYDFVLVCANFQGTGEPRPIQIARRCKNGVNQEGWEFCNKAPLIGCQGAWMDIEYGMDCDDITHWMSLPKPPGRLC